MKKREYWMGTAAFCLAGVLFLGGCGNDSGGGTADSSTMTEGIDSAENDDSTENNGLEGNRDTDSNAEYEAEPDAGYADSGQTDGGSVQEESQGKAESEAEEPICGLPYAGGNGSAAASESGADGTGLYDSYDDSAMQRKLSEPDYLESCYSYDWPSDMDSSEEYSKWDEKGFVSVMKEPRSTFAADVDTASYSILRRMIQDGYDLNGIPEGAARIEEMVNYFSYDYEAPKGKEPFGVTTQISACPWNKEAELLMIGLKTEEIDYSQAPPSNLVFLLDVSGSMGSDDKLPLLQESFGMLAENLTSKDRISIVTYAADVQTVLDGARGSETRKLVNALNSLQANGGTYGSKGIQTAYALAEKNYIQGGNNRVILATDGDLNIGLTTEEELEELITDKKESGIFLSVLGFGTGNIKDNKMETLADKGNGNYAYIDGLREARKVLVKEMSATLLTICKDVKFQVEFNPGVVKSYRLLGYENRALAREDFQDDTKDAGEIGAGHSVTVLYEMILKEPLNMDMTKKEIEDLKYRKQYQKEYGTPVSDATADKEEWLTVSIRYKKPAGTKSMLLEYPVGYESYTSVPSDDFVFAAAVAEFGLLVSHSQYPEDASVFHVEKTLRSMNLTDEYKQEFLELVQIISLESSGLLP